MPTPNASEQVVLAVAAETDTDPLDLPPLYETLDPDALDSVVHKSPDCTVTFQYAGCTLTVESSSNIFVDERPAAAVAAEADGLEVTD